MLLAAFVLTPFAPMAHAAMPPGLHQPMAGHCAGMSLPQDHKSGGKANLELCCQLACAIVAPMPAPLRETLAAPAPAPAFPLLSLRSGLHPGAEPPPPKAS